MAIKISAHSYCENSALNFEVSIIFIVLKYFGNLF